MFEDKKVLCLICARGGSKGVPGKNIKSLGGTPLIGWSITSAKQCSFFDRIVVSTDDKAISRIADKYGAETPFLRPAHLAKDSSPEWLVWQHAINELEQKQQFKPDYFVSLPPTSPFRSEVDIEKSVESLYKSNADIVISVTMSARNPYFNMVELDSDGFANLSKPHSSKTTRRQDAPEVFDMTTVVYAVRTKYVLNADGIFNGKVKTIVIPEIRALDIDTELDFEFADFLISKRLVQSKQ